MVKVLHIVSGLGIGGIQNLLVNLYRNADRKIIQFDFYSFCKLNDGYKNDIYVNEIESLGGQICFSLYSNSKKEIVKKYKELKELIRTRKYKIIHVHSCSLKELLLYVLIAKLCGVKNVIAHGHNPGIPKNTFIDKIFRMFMRKMISFCADYHFACSIEVAKSKYSNRIIKNKKYIILKNSIEIEKYRFNDKIRTQYREKLNINKVKVIGSIGRLDAQKNHKFMLEVFKEISLKDENTVLLLIGSGTLESELKKYAKELDISSKVIFYGSVQESAPYYNVIDIYLSTSFYEGFGISLLEAQANGCVCITSPVPDEVNITGELVMISLEDSIKTWVDTVLNSKQIQREGKADIIKNAGYDIVDTSKKIQEFYCSLLEK